MMKRININKPNFYLIHFTLGGIDSYEPNVWPPSLIISESL